MLGLSPIHVIVLLTIAVLVFKKHAVSGFLGDIGKGIRDFRKGIAEIQDTEDEAKEQVRRIERP
jgi:sec-independent protein translocase protein TatA